MVIMYHVTAEIRRVAEEGDGTRLEIRVDTPLSGLIKERHITHIAVGLEDGRHITPLQLRKAHAMIRDISEHTGYPPEAMKQIMKIEHMMRIGDYEYFSLGTCSVTTAREFINTLMEYALREGIILDEEGLKRTDDINTYLLQCIRYRRCCVCGRDADIHHVDAIGMGNDRRRYDDSAHQICALCRIHHGMAHQMGWPRFQAMYKVYGIRKYQTEDAVDSGRRQGRYGGPGEVFGKGGNTGGNYI